MWLINLRISCKKSNLIGMYWLSLYNSSDIYFTEDKMRKVYWIVLILFLSIQANAKGDIEQGRIKSYTCTGCHGIKFYKNVHPTYHVPRLGGQNEAYLVSALKAYRSGERSHSTMKAQAGSLTDEDIADISAYFASLKK